MNKKPAYSVILLVVSLIYLLINPVATWAETTAFPELNSQAAVLIDAQTGQVLFEKNMHQVLYPASITKIMTGIIALEEGNLDDTITMSREAVFSIGRNTSHVALDVDEELTLEQALYALAIESGNDAANGIAEHISGDVESFAQLMNKRAAEYGAKNTNFTNAHGLPDSDHYTTAYDMALILKQAVKNPAFREIFSARNYEMPPTNKQPESRHFRNRNSLLSGRYEDAEILASKTGWTTLAGHTLVTAARQENRELIAVVLNSQDRRSRYDDTIKLLDYGFNQFSEVSFSMEELTALIMPSVSFEEAEILNIEADQKMDRLLHKSLSVDDIIISHQIKDNHDNELVEVGYSLNLRETGNPIHESLGEITLAFQLEEEEEYIVAAENTTNYFLVGAIFPAAFLPLTIIQRWRKRRLKHQQFVNRFRY
ncbi:D-alanyl-D-alanine carboxypeptidase family protein [Dethiobacter alkaliphilus]|uniref:Serine-type D-Ala-D-Ala carboxypeptidase n=1 Tax=Dethiobacter alkaliphilus AHT 1 TaxID=555088 RepID=C0GFJ1_DETAL|nr:D-alanyl-D-alanine carboxypeptidase family protein [Dethiobacter alkaliphilus]EEG77951.1 Serine-type D-Ala-D-Ala carboxypeptidase [Dethiobacter alkaliphilus AHT 1]